MTSKAGFWSGCECLFNISTSRTPSCDGVRLTQLEVAHPVFATVVGRGHKRRVDRTQQSALVIDQPETIKARNLILIDRRDSCGRTVKLTDDVASLPARWQNIANCGINDLFRKTH